MKNFKQTLKPLFWVILCCAMFLFLSCNKPKKIFIDEKDLIILTQHAYLNGARDYQLNKDLDSSYLILSKEYRRLFK